MLQQTPQRELLAIPQGVTTLVATMSWDLPGVIQPEPWALAYNKDGVINGQHANTHFRSTYGGVITLDRNQPTAYIDLAKLIQQHPEAGGISLIANLYSGPQSRATFSGLSKASVEIGSLQYQQITPIARHDIDLATTDLGVFFLPLASIVRELDGSWSLAGGWCPLRYGS